MDEEQNKALDSLISLFQDKVDKICYKKLTPLAQESREPSDQINIPKGSTKLRVKTTSTPMQHPRVIPDTMSNPIQPPRVIQDNHKSTDKSTNIPPNPTKQY